MKKKYVAKYGSRISDAQARVFGPELERLKKKLGRGFTPDEVWKEGMRKSSPLCSYFQHDVKKAAEGYWRKQARDLINSIEVVIVKSGRETQQSSFMSVSVPEAKGRVYEDMDTIAGNPFLMDQVLTFAMDQAKRWREKYRNLQELTSIHQAIEKTEKRIRKGS